MDSDAVDFEWKGGFGNEEVNALHAEAFETRVFDDDWLALLEEHSLGWVVARGGSQLVGFVNVIWDGQVHAWIQDLMVATVERGRGVGTRLVGIAREEAKQAGCEWLHVDFDDHLRSFYYDACGFIPTNAGLIDLTR